STSFLVFIAFYIIFTFLNKNCLLIFYISNYLLILYPYQRKMLHYQAHTFPGKLIKDFFNRLVPFLQKLCPRCPSKNLSHQLWLIPGYILVPIREISVAR